MRDDNKSECAAHTPTVDPAAGRLFLMYSNCPEGVLLRRIVSTHWNCCYSTSVEEALLHLRFHKHDLIVCQLPLEDESVLGFLRTIYADSKLQPIPRLCVVIQSKSMRIPQKEMTFAAKLFGVSRCVEFPQSVEKYGELLSALAEHLPVRQPQNAVSAG